MIEMRKTVSTAFTSLCLLATAILMGLQDPVNTSLQEGTVGVNEDDWFLYSFNISFESTDPSVKIPPLVEFLMELDYMSVSVMYLLETRITFNNTYYYKNGTHESSIEYSDVDTGEGFVPFIPTNLSEGDVIWTMTALPLSINETILRTYLDEERETNLLTFNFTWAEDPFGYAEHQNVAYNYYWDRITGVPVETSFCCMNRTETFVTSWCFSYEIIDTNLWIISEFPSFLILPLFMLATLLAVIVYRRKHSM